jgi:hypothetical protein
LVAEPEPEPEPEPADLIAELCGSGAFFVTLTGFFFVAVANHLAALDGVLGRFGRRSGSGRVPQPGGYPCGASHSRAAPSRRVVRIGTEQLRRELRRAFQSRAVTASCAS